MSLEIRPDLRRPGKPGCARTNQSWQPGDVCRYAPGLVACLASSGKTKEGGFGRPFSQSEKYLRLRLAAARRRREIHARTAYPHAKPNSSTTRSKSRPDIKHRPYALIRSLCIHCYRPGSQPGVMVSGDLRHDAFAALLAGVLEDRSRIIAADAKIHYTCWRHKSPARRF